MDAVPLITNDLKEITNIPIPDYNNESENEDIGDYHQGLELDDMHEEEHAGYIDDTSHPSPFSIDTDSGETDMDGNFLASSPTIITLY
jgi:hypothetical protein